MGYVQLPDDLKSIIDQQVADGHASSEAEFVDEAIRLLAGYLAIGADAVAMVARADADIAAGRYVTVTSTAESGVVHERIVARLNTNFAKIAEKD